MINQKIGSFIATLRKEQNLTQEQLADKLGVSNRSVSRWENGKTLPDISIMYPLCQILNISIGELLSGTRQTAQTQRRDAILTVLTMFDRERQQKRNTLNACFALGFLSLLAVILTVDALTSLQSGVLAGLGIIFHATGFFLNNRDHSLTEREKVVLSVPEEEQRMRYPEEMLQFAKRVQNANIAQYKTAFRTIAEQLTDKETVMFTMVAQEFSVNGNPGIWHAGIAVTQTRILLCGETMSGLFTPRSVLNAYKFEEILSIQCKNCGIVLKTPQETVWIRGEHMSQLAQKLNHAVSGQQQ